MLHCGLDPFPLWHHKKCILQLWKMGKLTQSFKITDQIRILKVCLNQSEAKDKRQTSGEKQSNKHSVAERCVLIDRQTPEMIGWACYLHAPFHTLDVLTSSQEELIVCLQHPAGCMLLDQQERGCDPEWIFSSSGQSVWLITVQTVMHFTVTLPETNSANICRLDQLLVKF